MSDQDLKKIFNEIYEKNKWGKTNNGDLFSGSGSWESNIIDPYINAIKWFFSQINKKLDVIDFGCGDFNVGSRIRPFCKNYTAVDISSSIIQRNKRTFEDLDVNFICLDATKEDLPLGDVIFIRQVFQHLSNDIILKILPQLCKFRFIRFTDHVPASTRYFPNKDIETGAGVRLSVASGVDLTAHPFFLRPVSEFLLCAIPSWRGIIKTTAFRMF